MAVVMALQNLRADGEIFTEGGVQKMNVVDLNSEQVLGDMLKELKKMNLHMSLLTDTAINNTEVE